MNSETSGYIFSDSLKVKKLDQSIEFRLPIHLPQRVKKLFISKIAFSDIRINQKSNKVYSIQGSDSDNKRMSALIYILNNIDWHGKPLYDSTTKTNAFAEKNTDDNDHFKSETRQNSRKPYNSSNNHKYIKNRSRPYKSDYNHQKGKRTENFKYRPENSQTYQEIPKNTYNGIIKSMDDVYKELSPYLNDENKNIIKNMYENIKKFNDIIDYITTNPIKGDDKTTVFIQLCKIFSRPEFMESTNSNQIESIYSILFDPTTKLFLLRDLFNNTICDFLYEKFDDFQPIFDFFHSLIFISSSNAEMIKSDIKLLSRLTTKFPLLQNPVDELIEYAEEKKQMDIDSLESSTSPTMNDLLFSNDSIQNGIDQVWDNFNEYKKTMIDLTKLNFYRPFKTNLQKLKNNTLDARDLYLYQNVSVDFQYNTSYFSKFTDCNLFLKFEIRAPPNWTKKIPIPDWKHTERLANRSLLILSTDPNLLKFDAVCKSCAIARGKDENADFSIELLNRGILPATLVSGHISENKSYYMFEPTSCWTSVQPVLQRLSKMSRATFPRKFISIITKLDFSKNNEPEKRIIPTDVLCLNKRRFGSSFNFSFKANEEWDLDCLTDEQKDTLLRLDHEQYKALRFCLTHNLTLVNGAPGTGKTHLAREIIRVLNEVENIKPIAVISYTNHALDSLLEDVIKFVNFNEVIRWGGPTKSENPNLIKRKWSGRFLGKHLKCQKDDIATKKYQLRNLYNIRQMVANYIRCISSDPYNLNYYLTIFNFLKQFIGNIEEIFINKYPLPFNSKEILFYKEYLKCKKPGIQKVKLPGFEDAVKCWLHGEKYYTERNAKYIKIFNDNQKIVIGNTENRFKYLFTKEEEEEEEKPEKIVETEEEKEELTEDKNEKKDKKEEEEEISDDEHIYCDEDMIEMIKNSYFDANIGSSFQPQYVKKYIKEKFDILFSIPDSPKAMIRYLKEMSFPLTGMINEYEKQLQKEEATYFQNETISAGVYLRNMKLIGMTSTVASCRKEALEIAGCEIVIVEEAGELTESMLSCILPKTMKRLILIGDYQQLRPKVEYELTFKPFHYDISLFEKLVKNAMNQNADCLFTLSIQRRMHPQISLLLRNSFYQEGIEKINDDKSTYNHGIPFGIPHRVRFIMHDYPMATTSGRSYSNNKEAKFCASLIPFFICRGYKPEDITIISLYKGQKYEIEKEISNLFYNKRLFEKEFDSFGKIKNPSQFKVVVLDNFQGEENKVIIVSLTRSDKPGFVKNRNRALVTLSRAKEMLVVLGNRKIFGNDCKNNEIWNKISETASNISPYSMSTKECPGLAVHRCKIHNKNNDSPAYIETPEDIIKYRFSFCTEKCNHLLRCGHRCQLKCHCHTNPPGPNEHNNYICQFRCEKRCPNGHQCEGKCGLCSKGSCLPCKVIIHHVFEKCHHEADIMCHLVTSGKAKCQAKCGKKLSRCNHTCNLICGHESQCDCQVSLDAICPNCKRTFKYSCGKKPVRNQRCNHLLPCGHQCSNKCSECILNGHCLECQEKCNFKFACGHHCHCKCGDKSDKHQHQLCHHIINVGNIQQECCSGIEIDQNEKYHCSVCGKDCIHSSPNESINRCRCQCTKTCPKCGKRCRALTGEKCAFFCNHSELGEFNEPPEEDGPVFLFHGKHFMLVNDAIKALNETYDKMNNAIDDNPIPISRFHCPIKGCNYTEPCLIESWLFDDYNISIEKRLTAIRDYCIKKNFVSRESNYWYQGKENIYFS